MATRGFWGTHDSGGVAPPEVTVEGTVYRRVDLPRVISNFIPVAPPSTDDVITFNGERYRREPDTIPGVVIGPVVVTPTPATLTVNGVEYYRA